MLLVQMDVNTHISLFNRSKPTSLEVNWDENTMIWLIWGKHSLSVVNVLLVPVNFYKHFITELSLAKVIDYRIGTVIE